VLFQLTSRPVETYTVALVLAYGLAIAVAFALGRRDGRSWRDLLDGALVVVGSALVGAKLFHVLFEAEGHPLPDGTVATGVLDLLAHDPLHVLKLWQPGYVFYGGVITATFAGLAFVKVRRVADPFAAGDYAAPGLALGIFIGRIGCLLAGCCFGRPTTMPWGVRFDADHPTHGALVHPVQLYDAAFGLVAFLGCLWLYRRRRYSGEACVSLYLAYAPWRFLSEMFRGDVERGAFFDGALSTSQLLSLAAIPVLLAIGRQLSRGAPRAPREDDKGI